MGARTSGRLDSKQVNSRSSLSERDSRSRARSKGELIEVQQTRASSRSSASDAKTSSRARRYITVATNITIILAALALLAVAIYPGLQNWWQVRRDMQLLQSESDALAHRNDQIQALIDALGTAEGIESRAREEFGWVLPGEDAVNVSGLDSHNSSTSLPESIAPGSLRPDIDWITDTLDFIFNYEYPTPPPADDDVVIGL